MPGQGRTYSYLRSLSVANLSYHDFVGVLAQYRTQSRLKGKSGFVVDVDLVDAWNVELDGVLDCNYVDVWVADPPEHRVEGC